VAGRVKAQAAQDKMAKLIFQRFPIVIVILILIQPFPRQRLARNPQSQAGL
jgi:hypothetical protein